MECNKFSINNEKINIKAKELIDRLAATHNLSVSEYKFLIENQNQELADYAAGLADKVRREIYSGRVADKLQMAERMKQSSPDLIDYDKNIAALKEVQPAPVKASEIAVRVGTSWIDKDLYKEFFCQLIALPYYMRDGIELYYNKHDGSWRVDRTTGYVRNFRTMNVTSVYGTERANAYRLFEDCLNQPLQGAEQIKKTYSQKGAA